MDLDFDWTLITVFGFPIVIVALAMAYAAFHRYLQHRERMAMIEKGMAPDVPTKDPGFQAKANSSSSPIIITLVGIAVTLGLLTLGIGPWLIGGLVPTAYGCALLLKQILDEKRLSESKEKDE